MTRWLISILWPAFIVGGAAEAVFFTLFDPDDLHPFGESMELSRTAVYTAGFFLFWLFAAASGALTCYLLRGATDVNRPCLLDPSDRPSGCPRCGKG